MAGLCTSLEARSAGALVALALLLGAEAARAGDPESPPPPAGPRRETQAVSLEKPAKPPLEWRWARFRTGEWIATGLLAAATIPAAFIPHSKHPWTGTNGFDESARNALRASSPSGRSAASTASDVLFITNITYPVLVDSLVGGYLNGRSLDVALQMTAIDAEAFAFSGFATTLTTALTSRQRPYGRLCPTDPALQSAECAGNSRFRSFFSGHASLAFTSAGLVCSHHAHLPLFGGGAPEVVPCVTSMLAATATGMLRIVADRHYLSDVLVGAAVGSMSGFLVPWALHYRTETQPDAERRVSWAVVPTALGAAVIGQF